MKIHLYTMMWNEEAIAWYFMNHYKDIADIITVYDNESTDNSCNILFDFGFPGIEIIDFKTNDFSDGTKKLLFNNCWKQQTEEIAIIVDFDEFIYHKSGNTKEYIISQSANGINIFKCKHCNMFSETFPSPNLDIKEQIKQGRIGGDKNCIFNKNDFNEINSSEGNHHWNCKVKNNKIILLDFELYLLHYKNLSLEYIKNRYSKLEYRRSIENIKYRWGYHWGWSNDKIEEEFFKLKNDCKIIL